MRFMTYNIQFTVSSAHNPDWRPELFDPAGVVKAIAAQHPDVIALQEVECNRPRSGLVNQAKWLGERLGFQHAFAAARSDTNANGQVGHIGNAVLSRYPILDFRVIPLWHRDYLRPGEPAWVNSPRCCFIATIQNSEPIYVFGTHLSTTVDQRQKQIPQLANLVAELHDAPIVLLGDFNAGHEELQSSPLADQLTSLLQPNPVYTCPNGVDARHCIDHIWVSAHWTTKSVWVVSERLGVSDHNPVVADLELST